MAGPSVGFMRHMSIRALVVSSVFVAIVLVAFFRERSKPVSSPAAAPMNQGYVLTLAEQERLAKKAEAGDASAAFVLAEHFSVGTGDYEQYRKWLRRAADLGHPTAEYSLGYALMKEGNLGEARVRLLNVTRGTRKGDEQLRQLAESVLHQVAEASARVQDGKAPPR